MHRIDMDPAMEYTVRIEADLGNLATLLGEAVGDKISSYEVTKHPAGLNVTSLVMKKVDTVPHIKGFYANVKFYDNPDQEHHVFIAQSEDLGEEHPMDLDVFYYGGNFSQEIIRKMYSEEAKNGLFWIVPEATNEYSHCLKCGWGFIPSINGASASRCRNCSLSYLPDPIPVPVVEVENHMRDPERNRLHLFSIYTVDADMREGGRFYIMAQHDEAAVTLFHKARARDRHNLNCELIVDMISHAENADE